jgi:hypothetical protein
MPPLRFEYQGRELASRFLVSVAFRQADAGSSCPNRPTDNPRSARTSAPNKMASATRSDCSLSPWPETRSAPSPCSTRARCPSSACPEVSGRDATLGAKREDDFQQAPIAARSGGARRPAACSPTDVSASPRIDQRAVGARHRIDLRHRDRPVAPPRARHIATHNDAVDHCVT